MKDAQLKYSRLEKKAFALVQALLDFRSYIVHSHIVAYVLLSPVKAMLGQDEPTRRWAKWMARMQEFDLDVQSTNSVRGQGLCKLIVESQIHWLSLLQDENHDSRDEEITTMDICQPQ